MVVPVENENVNVPGAGHASVVPCVRDFHDLPTNVMSPCHVWLWPSLALVLTPPAYLSVFPPNMLSIVMKPGFTAKGMRAANPLCPGTCVESTNSGGHEFDVEKNWNCVGGR